MQTAHKIGLAALLLTCSPWPLAQAGIFSGNSNNGNGNGNGYNNGYSNGSGGRPSFFSRHFGNNPSPYNGSNTPYNQQGFGQPGQGFDPNMQGFGQPGMQQMQQMQQQQQLQMQMQQQQMQQMQAPSPSYVPAPPPPPGNVPLGDLSPEPPLAPPLPPSPPPAPKVHLTSNPVTRPAVEHPPESDEHLRRIHSPDPNVRAHAALQLGRLHSRSAVKPLLHLLKEDQSSQVRDAAARGLALIGAGESLEAVRHAALTDSDREVRHSASFAAEVIESRQRP